MDQVDWEIHDLEVMKCELILHYSKPRKEASMCKNGFAKDILNFALKKMYLRAKFLEVEIKEKST